MINCVFVGELQVAGPNFLAQTPSGQPVNARFQFQGIRAGVEEIPRGFCKVGVEKVEIVEAAQFIHFDTASWAVEAFYPEGGVAERDCLLMVYITFL